MRMIFTILARAVIGVACLLGLIVGAVGINEWLKDPEFFNK